MDEECDEIIRMPTMSVKNWIPFNKLNNSVKWNETRLRHKVFGLMAI